MSDKLGSWIGPLLLIIAGCWGTWWFLKNAFDELETLRQLERVPQSHVNAMLPGAVVSAVQSHALRVVFLFRCKKYLAVGDAVYAFGSAIIDPEQPERLVLAHTKGNEPLILSDYSEAEVMLKKARAGMTAFNFAAVSFLMAMLLAFAMHGSFAATDFLVSAMVAPLYLMVVMLVRHYNDLIFLQRRALRNWANIEVSLAKRRDVIRCLEPLVKGMLKHERQLLQSLAAMRAQLSADQHDVRQAEQFLAQEARVQGSIKAVLERYPELRSHALVTQFMATLSSLETEIALLREGYNDAVTYYNIRIHTVPDVVFARGFGFKPLQRLSLI